MDTKTTDTQLVQMALKNAEDFAHIMKKYETQLLVYIKRLTNIDTADAEDLLQEIFIKTYQNLNGFDQSLKFSSWIYRITHNHTISSFRKNKNAQKNISLEDNEELFKRLTDNTDLKTELDQKFQKEKIANTLSKLDLKYRDVLILKYLEDKDYNEISNILQKPAGTIATLLNRAKTKFKDLLIKHND